MANLKNIIKINQADYEALVAAGATGYIINGVRYYYSEDNLYLIEGGSTGSGKYLHNIQLVYSNTYTATFSFISTASAAYPSNSTGWTNLTKDLYSAGFTGSSYLCPAQGQWYSSGKTNLVTGVYSNSSSGSVITFYGITIASTSSSTMTLNVNVVTTTSSLGSAPTIYDVVMEL